ncbi:hypothetical protein [Reichenbachiella sp. MSK19-1]|uniref:hypothetical protein n=1 Tax=Reichenbachiella sp. MSK19-1 TaxID=1897631 RepID=UPI0011C3B605|nr:hypothetical protein [Reichenbachiella sp. MSK19-1]
MTGRIEWCERSPLHLSQAYQTKSTVIARQGRGTRTQTGAIPPLRAEQQLHPLQNTNNGRTPFSLSNCQKVSVSAQ